MYVGRRYTNKERQVCMQVEDTYTKKDRSVVVLERENEVSFIFSLDEHRSEEFFLI